ncbi:MAG: histidine kinase [Candidatus Limivivens sp.]|nr:histidine kinase [Candidatus Limivivens sp.]
MKKISLSSLKSYVFCFLAGVILLFAVIVFYNNYKALELLRRNIYANTMDTLVLYQKNLDERLGRTETYLCAKLIDNSQNLNTLRTASLNETSWFSAHYQLVQNFNAALPTYTTNCFFCYLPEKNQYIQCHNSNAAAAAAMKKTIPEKIRQEEVAYNTWMLLCVEGDYYFVYVLNYQGTCIGSWCSMAYLLDSVSDNSRLHFSTAEGNLLRDRKEPLSLTAPEKKSSPYLFEQVEGEEMLSVSHSLETAPVYLTMLIPESEVSNRYQTMVDVIVIVALGFLIACFGIFYFLRRYLLKPIFELTEAITRLRKGDLDVYIPVGRHPDEFQHMARAFNEMVCEIKDLKIDVYERKLQRQRLEMEYLKQQITPHFMINCLNTAYQLTETNRLELARKMLRDLSMHLRYTLSSGQTVPLSEELTLTQNYIELSGIRYPGSIVYVQECPEELLQATAMPLLILNFVENTIKYEVTMGEKLEIHVEISSRRQEGQELLDICIWDTGKGFDPAFLERLQDLDNYAEHENYHIGIVNTYLRARHVYQNPQFSFCNRPQAGAQIFMTLPCLPFENAGNALSKGGLR